MNNSNRGLDIFILVGLCLATWELYIAYKNKNESKSQFEFIKDKLGKEN